MSARHHRRPRWRWITAAAVSLALIVGGGALALLGSRSHAQHVPSAASLDHPVVSLQATTGSLSTVPSTTTAPNTPSTTAKPTSAPSHSSAPAQGGGTHPIVVQQLDHPVQAAPAAVNGGTPRAGGHSTITLPGRSPAPIVEERVVALELGIPANVHDVGLDTQGTASLDAAYGTTVIAGHINFVSQGNGAFSGLQSMRPGERVATVSPSGHRQVWKVVSERLYSKATGLPDSLFAQTGGRRLVMLSCGGKLNTSIGSYESNVAVVAVPVG